MAVQICPLFDAPYFTYTMDLSQETFGLTFRYSSRSEGYLLDIFDAEESPIIRNIQLVPVTALIKQYALDRIQGEFLLLPIESTSLSESGITNPRELYKTHYLSYITED